MDAVTVAALDSEKTIRVLDELHTSNIKKLPITKRAKDNMRLVFNYIENYPIIDIKKTAKDLEISYNTASSVIREMVELGMLREKTNKSRIGFLYIKSI